MNNTNQNYAKVQVKENKSIEDKSVLNQVMPVQPSKVGFTFTGWNTKSDGTGAAFNKNTPVTSDITVYEQYKKLPNPGPLPQLTPVPNPQPKPEPKPQPNLVPAPAPSPKVSAVQQEEPTKTPNAIPPVPGQPALVPNDTPASQPPAHPAGEQHVQQARMPRTSDMALLRMLASAGVIAGAVVCGAITALKRRK